MPGPFGSTARPYDKPTRDMAEAKKKLKGAVKNKTIKDMEGGDTRGDIMGLSGPSDEAAQAYRDASADRDRFAAAGIRGRPGYGTNFNLSRR